jgi:GAF domain-containing protein
VRERGLRFYAGVPIPDRFGEVLGTLCLLDFHPRPFTAFDLELLSILSRRVAAELEWREKRRKPHVPDAAFRYLAWLDEELDVLGREAFLQAVQAESLRAAESRRDLSLAVVSVAPERLRETSDALKGSFPGALFARLGFARLGLLAFGEPLPPVLARAEVVAGPDATVRGASVPRIVGGAARFLRLAETVSPERGEDAAPPAAP